MGILSGICSAIAKKIGKNTGTKQESDIITNNDINIKNNNPFAGDEQDNGSTIENEKKIIKGLGENHPSNTPFRESGNMMTNFDIPDWGYKDFINERVNWQKGLNSSLGDPVWFYFKIFFKFDSTYGLLGGILGGNRGYMSNNTAHRYLSRNISYDNNGKVNNSGRYGPENISNRRDSLIKFVQSLSWISCNTPWFFKSVKDASNALVMDFSNLTKEKTIEIECNDEATDMRLMTLMDLYKYAAYDEIHQKEILPENLRKFDMDIVVFQAPIRYWHTSLKNLKNKTTKYKTLNSTDYGNRMSFKLLTFQNCEIDYSSLTTFLPQSMDNSAPFSLKSTFRIKYDRVYQHLSNEFANLLVGTKGLTIFDTSDSEQNKRLGMLEYALDNKRYYNSASSVYKALVDASEDTISNAMRTISAKTAVGNLYGNYGVDSDYGKSKIRHQKDGTKKIDYSSVDSTSVCGAITDSIKAFGTGYKNWFNNTVASFTDGWASSKSNSGNMNPTLFSRESNKNELAGQYNKDSYGNKTKSSYAKNGYKKESREVDWTSNMVLKGNTPKTRVEHHKL